MYPICCPPPKLMPNKMTPKKKLAVVLIVLVTLAAIWLVANPPGRFGWCCFACTTYGSCPRVVSDLQVRADGETRSVEKTHDLTFENIAWLLEPKPDVLIIAIGWDGKTTPDRRIREYQGCEVHLLKNDAAIVLFNRLKKSGQRVAIHYHSTC